MSHDPRVEGARALLRAAGLAGAGVETAGHDSAIAVITRLPAASLPELAELAPRIKALGFRYVTLDIGEEQ